MDFKVVYLTGAPATGKSTLSRSISEKVSDLVLFTYSKELADHLTRKSGEGFTQEQMREKSSQVITPDDVNEVDEKLVALVEEKRHHSHIIIDSHAVTKEGYGFRITPFSGELLKRIDPDLILVLYTAPELALERIEADAQGRPTISIFEANMHTSLQASVAINYATILGKPAYFLDSSKPLPVLVAWLRAKLER